MSNTLQKRRDQLRALYGFDWPDDLFRFWEFARRLKPLEPLDALADTLGVRLSGPFEVLDGRFDGRAPHFSPLLHWRYYLDPPEFFTILIGSLDGLHWGYWMDDPRSASATVASYYANDAFDITSDGANLFEALRLHVEFRVRDCEDYREEEPDLAVEFEELLEKLDRLRKAIQRYATDNRPETGDEYAEKYLGRAARTRRKRVQAMTQDGMGIVVHPELYRALALADKKLWRRLWKESDPIEVVTEARQALRDGFPGTALKLGKDLWAVAGVKHTDYAYELLDAAYEGLKRESLRRVLREHRLHRDRPWLDVLHDEEAGAE